MAELFVEQREEAVAALGRRRHLLIGQAPARSASPEARAWDSASAERLSTKLGLPLDRSPRGYGRVDREPAHPVAPLLALFDTTNLNPTLLGTRGKYDAFDEELARHVALGLQSHLIRSHHRYDLVLCAGQKVARLMGAPMLDVAHTSPIGERAAGIPHPGGTNRWYNDPENRERADRFLRELGRTL